MKGLLIKDFYNLKKTMNLYLIMTLILCAYCLFTNKQSFVSMMPILIFSTTVTSTFSMDSSVKWDKLAVPAPLRRSDIVKSKYVLLLVILALGVCVGFAFALPGILQKKTELRFVVEMTLFSAAIALCAGSLAIALFYLVRRTIEKMELVIVFAYAGAALIVVGITRLISFAASPFHMDKIILSVISFLLVFVIYGVSYRIAVKAYEGSDIS